MTKGETIIAAAAGQGCLGRAAEDEPVFVLRAHDRIAPGTVRDWAERARKAGLHEDKVEDAMVLAMEMEHWARRDPRVPGDRAAAAEPKLQEPSASTPMSSYAHLYKFVEQLGKWPVRTLDTPRDLFDVAARSRKLIDAIDGRVAPTATEAPPAERRCERFCTTTTGQVVRCDRLEHGDDQPCTFNVRTALPVCEEPPR